MKKLMLFVSLTLGCAQSKFVGNDEDSGGSDVLVCDGLPEIDHDEFDDPQPNNAPVTIETTVIGDPTPGCENILPSSVTLYFKSKNVQEYSQLRMLTQDDYTFSATITPAEMTGSKMLYYFKAVASLNSVAEEPEGAKDDDRNTFSFTRSL